MPAPEVPPSPPGPHLGLDVGGSGVKVSLLAADLSVLRADVVELPDLADDPAGNLEARLDVLADAVRAAGPTATVGIATPGVVDAAHRRIVALPGKLAGLEGVDWGEALGAAVVAASAPLVLNDGHAAVLGEATLGAGRGADDVAMLTLGTGVGGGVMIGGRLFEGRRRRAGQLGHLSLDPYGAPSVFPNPGSLEWFVGDAYAAARTDGRFAGNAALVAAVRRGDAAALGDWRALVRALAVGIASIVHAFDCERVVLGGGLIGPVRCCSSRSPRTRAVEWRPDGVGVPVVPAALGRHSGSVGAALYGRERSTSRMNFWLASANPRDVARHMELGVWRGVITNPAVVAAERRAPKGAVHRARRARRPRLVPAPRRLQRRDARGGRRHAVDRRRAHRHQGARDARRARRAARARRSGGAPDGDRRAHGDLARVRGGRRCGDGGALRRDAAARRIASKHDEVLRMQQIVDAQGYDLELCVGLYDPTDVPMYARAGVRAGFVWARDVERFFAQPLVDEACAGFADDWATIDAARTE
jgi:glucokinase